MFLSLALEHRAELSATHFSTVAAALKFRSSCDHWILVAEGNIGKPEWGYGQAMHYVP
jgi:hypothetical protein